MWSESAFATAHVSAVISQGCCIVSSDWISSFMSVKLSGISFIFTVLHQNMVPCSPHMIHSRQYSVPTTYQIDSAQLLIFLRAFSSKFHQNWLHIDIGWYSTEPCQHIHIKLDESWKETEKMVVQDLQVSTRSTTGRLSQRRNDVLVAFVVLEVWDIVFYNTLQT